MPQAEGAEAGPAQFEVPVAEQALTTGMAGAEQPRRDWHKRQEDEARFPRSFECLAVSAQGTARISVAELGELGSAASCVRTWLPLPCCAMLCLPGA